MPHVDARSFLPLPPIDFQVLLTLSDGPCHAYGLATAVEDQAGRGVRLELGSLYRILTRLTKQGIIAEARCPQSTESGSGPKRRCYEITPFGRQVTRAETARLEAVLRVARRKIAASGAR